MLTQSFHCWMEIIDPFSQPTTEQFGKTFGMKDNKSLEKMISKPIILTNIKTFVWNDDV